MSRPLVVALCLFAVMSPALAYCASAPALDRVTELEERAARAQPEEQCYVYAQLVSELGEVVDRQLASGDAELAAKSLAKMEDYAARIHKSLGPKNKKLKESEILVRHTERRVEGMFHQAAIEQQDMLRATLHKLNDLQSELMLSVFHR